MKLSASASAVVLVTAICTGSTAPSTHSTALRLAGGRHGDDASAPSSGSVDALGLTVTPPSPRRAAPPVTKVMVIWEENHATSAYGSMPYLSSLAARYGKATNYWGVVHPSLGNYLVAASGKGAGTCGLRDPLPAACPQSGRTVFGQALAAGKTAKTYAESMTSSCRKTNGTTYAARHNPWTYATVEAASCRRLDVSLGTTTGGALLTNVKGGTLPNASMVIPNLNDDAHNGTLQQADGWLAKWMPVVMAGPDYRAGRLAVVITFDEGVGSNQRVPFVLVNPRESHRGVTVRFDHYSLCRLFDDVLVLPALKGAAGAPGLAAAFGL